MDNDKICEVLNEISLYFYQCYRNTGGGTKACEKFHDYMCAVDEAKDLLKEQEAIKPTAFVDKDTGETRYVCSNCGYEVRYEELVASGIVEIKHSYCPSCGKKVKWE